MESIKGHDRWLDPPEEPTHWECDKCGGMFDGGDLNQIGKQDYWLCDDCLKDYKAEEEDE